MSHCGFCHGELNVGQLFDRVKDAVWHRACAVQEGHVEAPTPPVEEEVTPEPAKAQKPAHTPQKKASQTTKKTSGEEGE